MCCLWTNKQFATNLNCKPNHQWIFLLFSLYFLIKFLWNYLCSMYAQIFRNAIFFYIWWNSLTIFGRCTYFSLKQLNNNFILHISMHGLWTRDKSFFFKISQMVFFQLCRLWNKLWAIWGTFEFNLIANFFFVFVVHHFPLHNRSFFLQKTKLFSYFKGMYFGP